jgi:hypothetical protein
MRRGGKGVGRWVTGGQEREGIEVGKRLKTRGCLVSRKFTFEGRQRGEGKDPYPKGRGLSEERRVKSEEPTVDGRRESQL